MTKKSIFITGAGQGIGKATAKFFASKGWFVAMVATTVETANPEAEIQPGLNLLGPIKQKFLQVSDVFAPIDPGTESQLFISKSYDPTSHFETTCLVNNELIIVSQCYYFSSL